MRLGEKIDIADLLKKTEDPDGTREIETSNLTNPKLFMPRRAAAFFPGIHSFAGSIGRTELVGAGLDGNKSWTRFAPS